jgi:hypothetical protein
MASSHPVQAPAVLAFDWGKFFSDLVMKPATAFRSIRQANMWWFPLAVLFTVGLFWGISFLIVYRGANAGFIARNFFASLMVPFLYVLFEAAALKWVSAWFLGKGSEFRGFTVLVADSWIAFVPYAILSLIPSQATNLIFLILSFIFHLYLLTGVLEEEEGLDLGKALLVGIIPFLFLIVLFALKYGTFGIFG